MICLCCFLESQKAIPISCLEKIVLKYCQRGYFSAVSSHPAGVCPTYKNKLCGLNSRKDPIPGVKRKWKSGQLDWFTTEGIAHHVCGYVKKETKYLRFKTKLRFKTNNMQYWEGKNSIIVQLERNHSNLTTS